MDNFRFRALEATLSRQIRKVETPSQKISDYYGDMTFNINTMKEYLSVEAFAKVTNAIGKGEKIERKIADQIAAAVKSWAISKGATHYTHWFHPLTGSTAEKHDAFINPIEEGKAIEQFNGDELSQQEPDASSFPSGGIRNTFEARGYTAWDPTSSAFILDSTLCIPTIFVSYTGEALDYKTPLLKALSVMDKASVSVCNFFDRNISKVNATLGWEQEYFLLDRALYIARPDLVLSGRTLFGHASAKDQQLSDHYFGAIPDRVIDFMKELELEAHKLGIPLKTRHNEVAPSQFECAPVYEEANLSVDHNQMLMHLMDKVGRYHNLKVLLHEKPYAKVNGSGKHCNWSLLSNTGENLLIPGKTSRTNLRFLTFLINIIKGVNDNADYIRSSVASAGNDHRLGAHEAPPAIISVFIESQLTQTLEEFAKGGKIKNQNGSDHSLSIPKIPEILLDNTDRNRTSPFAFTGNKFEFRAVGSAMNTAKPMIALNLILADQLNKFKKDVDALVSKNISKNNAIIQVLKKYYFESKGILFEGNNYSDEWIKEAEKRGLSNIKSTPHALQNYLSPKTVKLFENNNVLSEKELIARNTIRLENYTKIMQIESRVIGDLATNHIIPIAIKYQNTLIENVKGLKEVLDIKTYTNLSKNSILAIKEVSEHIEKIKNYVTTMLEARKHANRIEEAELQAVEYNEQVIPYFDKIRRHIDKLELLIDDELWPLPKYRELLFMK